MTYFFETSVSRSANTVSALLELRMAYTSSYQLDDYLLNNGLRMTFIERRVL